MLQLFASIFADFGFLCIFTGIKFSVLLKLKIYLLVATIRFYGLVFAFLGQLVKIFKNEHQQKCATLR